MIISNILNFGYSQIALLIKKLGFLRLRSELATLLNKKPQKNFLRFVYCKSKIVNRQLNYASQELHVTKFTMSSLETDCER